MEAAGALPPSPHKPSPGKQQSPRPRIDRAQIPRESPLDQPVFSEKDLPCSPSHEATGPLPQTNADTSSSTSCGLVNNEQVDNIIDGFVDPEETVRSML